MHLKNFFSKDFYENLFEINLEKGCAITLKITEDGPNDYKTSSQTQAFFETARILLKKISSLYCEPERCKQAVRMGAK
jgi:hypothetical protein